jgi:hypothetical protein
MAKSMTMDAFLGGQQKTKIGSVTAKNLLAKQKPIASLVRRTATQNLSRYLRPTAHR